MDKQEEVNDPAVKPSHCSSEEYDKDIKGRSKKNILIKIH